MPNHFNSETITVQKRTFEVRFYYDGDRGRPWENSDGHGPVRELRSREDKRPGERIMTSGEHHSYVWAYDVQAATKLAKKDGWGLSDKSRAALVASLKREPTKGEIVAAAVAHDFEFLNGWVNDDWHYMGVAMLPVDKHGVVDESDEYAHAVWGIESDGEYWREVAEDLASEIIRADKKAFASRMREARECKYWASRDVMTLRTRYAGYV